MTHPSTPQINIQNNSQLEFLIQLFKQLSTETDAVVRNNYIAILTRKKLASALFTPELQKPEYEGSWAKFLGSYFTQYKIEPEHKALCEWVIPIMMQKHLENFRQLSTYQKDNQIFKDIYKEAKKSVGENMSEEEFTQTLKKINKLKDMEIVIKALDNNPALATPTVQKLALEVLFLKYLDSSGKVARFLEKLNISTQSFVAQTLPMDNNNYSLNNNFTNLNFYWVQKIFSGTEISTEKKNNIITRYFNRQRSYGKNTPEKIFLSSLYHFVEGYKTTPKSLVVLVPYVQSYLINTPELKEFQTIQSKTDNPFLWLLNFLQQHSAKIDTAVSKTQATSKLQKTLIQLEEKNLAKEIKKVKPVKNSDTAEIKKKFKI